MQDYIERLRGEEVILDVWLKTLEDEIEVLKTFARMTDEELGAWLANKSNMTDKKKAMTFVVTYVGEKKTA